MQITLKLFATLGDYLPADRRRGNEVTLELPEGCSVSQALEPFALPPRLVHLVLVNGHYIEPQARATHALAPGDALAVWPPIAGG